MELYRICLTKYCTDISGKGAELCGGRWNRKGVPMIYTSSNRALSVLETLANSSFFPQNVSYSLVTLEIPNSRLREIKVNTLPKNWSQREYSESTLSIGTEWVYQKNELAISVPSCIMREEYNVLLNVWHRDFHSVKITHVREFEFDPRVILRHEY
jgi:RES domain-containing protein